MPELSPASPLHSPTSSEADSANHSDGDGKDGQEQLTGQFPPPMAVTSTPRNVVLVIPPGAPVSLSSSSPGLAVPKTSQTVSQYPPLLPKKANSPVGKQTRTTSPAPVHPVLLAPLAVPVKQEVKVERPPSRPASARPSPAPTPSGGVTECTDFAAKREQRKIRNREAAQLSRQRRKEAVEELGKRLSLCQAQCEALRKENVELHSRVASLTAELADIRKSSDNGDAEPRRKLPRTSVSKAAFVSLMAIFGLLTFSITPLAGFNPVLTNHFQSSSPDADVVSQRSLETLQHFHSRTLMGFDPSSAEEGRDVLRERIARVHRTLRESAAASNITKEECRRLYVNQTQARQLADELSLWMEMHTDLSKKPNSPPWGTTFKVKSNEKAFHSTFLSEVYHHLTPSTS